MDSLENMLTRRTYGRLVDPAPGAEVLQRAFEAAIAAPDHKRLRPWQFMVVEGVARDKLGKLMAKALKEHKPDADDGELERERGKPVRAPMIIACIAKIEPGKSDVPAIEQLLAAGAATQNLILALHAQGFGTAWKTGKACSAPVMRDAFGCGTHDEIIGFVYVGSIKSPMPPLPPTAWTDYVLNWV